MGRLERWGNFNHLFHTVLYYLFLTVRTCYISINDSLYYSSSVLASWRTINHQELKSHLLIQFNFVFDFFVCLQLASIGLALS